METITRSEARRLADTEGTIYSARCDAYYSEGDDHIVAWDWIRGGEVAPEPGVHFRPGSVVLTGEGREYRVIGG